jgi:hypothetical protein
LRLLLLSQKAAGQIGALKPKSNDLDTPELVWPALYVPGKRGDGDHDGLVEIFSETRSHLGHLAINRSRVELKPSEIMRSASRNNIKGRQVFEAL